ncbi:alpha-L-rhamnosidase C-terminal domain-containing protein [Paenibacillus daejeonensis]|uniref:alpha-L-rhamnosidase C-terminal domain-containing protein n=1 Tax=Paenibacillus daejeonensis TaxID=135193 RepID=UPI000375F45B|nr:alpha-L-rhamnosidase C-terminal domain-containing protein [Paenibacillus daejeonensis]
MVSMRTAERIPQWIWHRDLHGAPSLELVRNFVLESPVSDAEFRIALTGAVEVEIDGMAAGQLEESAANVCAFHRMAAFPATLAAGEHTIRLRIACSVYMPTAPVSMHLHERTVGCAAFLTADGFWLRTDDSWSAGGTAAKKVCLLGEEPFGDVEDAPAWFVAGGFGDIETMPLSGWVHLSARLAEVSSSTEGLQVSGMGRGVPSVPVPARQQLHLFYHVRKQAEWLDMNEQLQRLDRSLLPACTVDLGKEYNVRFHLRNRCSSSLIIIWQGAESLQELENYAGLMTEVVRLEPLATQVTLPQGLRYVRMTILVEEGEAFDLVWYPEEVVVPMQQLGSLHTDSPLLRDIYDMSLHTNRICHQIGLWDGIKRDRLNWAYDFYLAAKADYVLWDDLSVLRRSILELGKGTPVGYWMNDIPAYTLWWINNIWEYYLHTGDDAFVLSLEGELNRHIQQVIHNIHSDSGELMRSNSMLIEWVPMDAGEGHLCMQALLRLTGENVRKLKRYLPALDALPDWGYPSIGEEPFMMGEQLITPLLGIISGYVGEQEAEHFLRRYTVSDPITPLSAYWLADCCSRFGLQEKAWQVVSLVWGKMLSEGATACWESITLQHERDFHDALTTYTAYDSYRISLCHSWAATPIHWIVSRVLGVTPVEPGYRAISLRMQPIEGFKTCWGHIPTPYGQITAGWNQNLKEPNILELPDGIRIVAHERNG